MDHVQTRRQRSGTAERRLVSRAWSAINPAPGRGLPLSQSLSQTQPHERRRASTVPATSGFSRCLSGADSPARLLAMQKVEGPNPSAQIGPSLRRYRGALDPWIRPWWAPRRSELPRRVQGLARSRSWEAAEPTDSGPSMSSWRSWRSPQAGSRYGSLGLHPDHARTARERSPPDRPHSRRPARREYRDGPEVESLRLAPFALPTRRGGPLPPGRPGRMA
jgi:hypothetical protein